MSDQTELRVLIAEDEALVRQGIVALLQPEVASIVEIEDGEQAIHALSSEPFDVALIDIGLPKRSGLDVLSTIRKRGVDVKIIILTGDTATHSPADVYAQGADGFLYKTTDATIFLETFLAVAHNKPVSNPLFEPSDQAKSVAQIRDSLTARELQIVKLIAEGHNNKETAAALFISVHTVRKHREHINRKLNIKSPTALAAFAINAKLI
jgi:DNA-binding NarL/FixJ family response regulator